MNLIPIPAGLETECFVLEADAFCHAPELFRRSHPGRPVWIVADGNTWEAAGEKLSAILEAAGIPLLPPYLFPAKPILHATTAHVDELLEVFPEGCLPVAVGSGTVNDLVKRASGVRETRYCCIPTASSVDGYTSFGAALSVDGFKKTLPCPAPQLIIADTDILDHAPKEMFASGYADLMAKIPAGADWIVADLLGEHSIQNKIWEMIQHPLRDWLATPADNRRVFMGLAATGYAMQSMRDSRPASGAEHLISHVWEMEGLEYNGESVSHGFKVSVGTVAVTRLYEALFQLSAAEARQLALPPSTRKEREAEIDSLLRRGCYGEGVKETALDKFIDGPRLSERRELLYRNWESLKTKVLHQLYPSHQLIAMLKENDCPVSPADIGVPPSELSHAFATAQLIRKRYTALDLVYELGLTHLFRS